MPQILYPPAHNSININPSILSFYSRAIVPLITRRSTKELASYKRAKGTSGGEEFEDDGNYGSVAIADVAVLQVISKRIHYGQFSSSVPSFLSRSKLPPSMTSRQCNRQICL